MSYSVGPGNYYTIDSAQRISGDHSEFTYSLDLHSVVDFDRVCVIQASIPKSYYLVDASNQTFVLVEDDQSASVTLAPGNYTRRTFASNLGAALTEASPHDWIYTVKFSRSPDNGKYIFTVAGNGVLQPSLVFGDELYEQLGFEAGSTNLFIDGALVSRNVIKMQIEDNLFIQSDLVKTGDNRVPLLQEIFAGGTTQFGAITYQCPDVVACSKKFNRGIEGGNVFKFLLTSERSKKIKLNGQNMVFSLYFYKSRAD